MSMEIDALSEPTRKLTKKLRRRFWALHEKTLDKPWWRTGPTQRTAYTEDDSKLAKANAKRDRRRAPSGFVKINTEPKSAGLKIVNRLNALPMRGLIRLLCKSARRAATAKYAAAKCNPGKFQDSFLAEQSRQIALFRAADRMIKFRLNPNPNFVK